jgi:hypothetical protein
MAGSAGVLGAAAVVAAHAANATFTAGTTQVAQTEVKAGNVYLTAPGAGTTNRMTLSVDNLYAAKPDNTSPWRERAINVTNAGSIPLTVFSISSVADTNNHLTGDTGSPGTGVLMIIDECSQAWTEGGTVSEPTYTCGGTSAEVLGCAACGVLNAPVDYDITPNVTSSYTWSTSGSPALSNIELTASSVNHLRFRFKLAYNASPAAQGQSANVTFTFDGTPRSGTSK